MPGIKGHKNLQRKPRELSKKYKVGFVDLLDKRTESYKLLNKAVGEVIEDLGGAESLSHVQLVLVERFCFCECLLRRLEYRMVRCPKKMDGQLANFVQILNSVIRLSSSLGLKRKAKKITSLQVYVKDRE